MHIQKKIPLPSRADAKRLTRTEKLGALWFSNTVTIIDDLRSELSDRLGMVESGPDRMQKLYEEADALFDEVACTIPVEQRRSLQNTIEDHEMRIVPKLTPSSTNVLLTGDEFKEIIDIARAQCRECTETDTSCEKCRLFKILTVVLPLNDYSGMLCPYNMGEWAN